MQMSPLSPSIEWATCRIITKPFILKVLFSMLSMQCQMYTFICSLYNMFQPLDTCTGRQLAQEQLPSVVTIAININTIVFETNIWLFISWPLPNIHCRIQFIFIRLCFLYPQPKWWKFNFNLFEFHPFTMSDEECFKQAWNVATIDINIKCIQQDLDTCLMIQTGRIQAHVEQRRSQGWGWQAETCSPWWRVTETDQDGDTPATFIGTALVSSDNWQYLIRSECRYTLHVSF